MRKKDNCFFVQYDGHRARKVSVNSEQLTVESCIVKKDCSKSENMVKYFQESERDEKENELHKGV